MTLLHTARHELIVIQFLRARADAAERALSAQVEREYRRLGYRGVADLRQMLDAIERDVARVNKGRMAA